MKILLWTTNYLPSIGGLEIMVHSLALELKKRGHEIFVVCNGEETKEYSIDEIRVWTFPFTKALHYSDLGAIRKILDLLEDLLDRSLPDVVNVHGWFEGFCFYQERLLRKKKIPFCITIHGLLEQKHYQTTACLNLWSMARAINTVSEALVKSLKEQGFHHLLLKVIYNGLPVPTKPLTPIPLNPPQLTMIGRLTEEKCFDVAFHAMKILVKRRPDLNLCLIGGGERYKELDELRKSLGLDAFIEMTDFVPPHKVYTYIDKATIVLIPSRYESFCLVALEAAFRGRPVIASNVYGLKEVVAPFQTGLLIEPKDPSALAEAVERLLSNPSDLKRMGKEGFKRAQEYFTIEKTAENYLKMYQEIL